MLFLFISYLNNGGKRLSLLATFLAPLLAITLPFAASAQVSRAIYCASHEDYIEVPHNAALNFTNNFSIECWLKPAATQTDMSANFNNILVKTYNYSGAIPFGFQFLNSGTDAGKLKVIRKNSTGISIANYLSDNRIDDGKFHHIAFVKDSTSSPNLKLYVDGILQGIGVSDIAGTTNNNNSLYLGRSGEAQNPFSGAFDELKIWKNARSAANVLSDMTSVAPSTMIAYYNMETGLKNKGSASSVNGFLGGNAVFFPTQKSYGNALHFDGINDFVNFSTNLGTFTNQMTVDVWIRPESLGGTQIIATQIGKWELKLLAGKPVFSVNTTTGTTFVVSANAALSATQNWYHIAGVFSANGVSNRITLYLNGEIENTITSGTNYAIATAGTGMMLGAKGTTTSAQSYFKGMIDELNVWNTALTADNIVAEMNVGDATANVNHLAYFPFDQGIPSGGNSSQNSLINVFANGNGLLYNFSLSNTSSNWVARAAYLEAPNASLVSGNTYHFEGNISETGTGKLLGNGFLLSNSSINSYPNYANSAVNVAETTLGETTFEKNSLLSPFYKSYVIGTEGVSLSTQSTGPCVTGFPVGNITFSGGSTAVSVSWTAVPNVTSYDWRLIAPDGDLNTPDQKGNLQSNTLLLKGLDPGSRYYFYLRAKCGGGLGEWVGPAFFATTSSPYLNADSLKNDNYIDIDWALPSAYFIQNAANGVHIQLKNGNNILYEQPITDYTPYQGAPQPTFSFVANTNLQQYYAINNTTSWAALNSWTMETWVKMAATNLNSTRLFQNVNGTNPFTVWIDSADKQVKLSLNNVIYSFSAMQLPVEQWFHLAVSYGNGEANLYIEGIFAAKISLPSLQTSGGNFQVLYACNQVAMAELRFWNRVRTAEEIKYNKAVATFSGVIQNNLLLQWKWQAQTVPPTDLATTYDGLNNDGALFQVGGGQILSYNHTTYLATPYYAAIRGTFRHYTGPSASKAYKLNGYQIGSGAIINAIYFPPQDTGKTLAYQPITNLKADSTPFNILLSWKNKSKVSEFFRIRRTAGNGTNSVTLATISGTDKIDSLMTFTDTYSLEDSTIFNNGTAYRYYIDTYSPTFNRIFDSLRYDLVNIPAINVVASDNLFSSKVEITWNNLNSFGYQIRIERDDETLATLNPSLTSYTDLYPIYGKRHRYSVMLLDPATNNALAAGFDRGGVQAKGTISGNAYTNVGDFALKDVKILLTNISNNTKDSTYTDENGQFSFGNVYYGQSGDIVLNAFFLNHKFLNSPRTLSLSNQDYGFTNVIFKDSTTWENDSLNTSFTLSNFVASPLSGQDKVSLTWDYSLTAGDTLKMNVYRGSELIDVLNCTSGTNISIFDSTGKPNYVYNYSLTAYKFEGNTIKTLSRIQENISYPAITSPAAFTAVVSTAQGVVNLAWTHSSRNYNGFKIYRAQQTANPSPPSDTVLIATLENGIFTFKDKQTLAGTSGYKYVIRAYRTVENLTFESAKIISGSINYPPLPVLSVLTATPTPARNSMSFTWTLPANSPLNDTAYNYDGYVIYRKKNTPANSPYQLVGSVYKHFPKNFEDKTGLPSIPYTYQVRAFLKTISPATKKDTMLFSAGIIRSITYPLLKAPISLAISNNINFVNLTWTPAINQSGGARNFDGQTVYWKVNSVTDSAEIPISQNTYTHYTNNTNATPTIFSVRSFRKINGVKYNSTAISGGGYATGSNPANLPLPQQFKASQNLPAHIRLSWSYPNYILATFRVYKNGTLVAILPNETREYYDYSAANYQQYLYEIEATYGETTTLKASSIGKRNTLSSLTGRVYANNSKYGLPFVEVSVTAQGYFARTFTDSTGFYRIDNLPTQQSLPLTVSADGGNTKFSTPNFPASQTFSIDGERYKLYKMDFVSDYSPSPKDTARVCHIAYLSATPDPARKRINIAWSPTNRNYDGFYIYRANSLIGTAGKGEPFMFSDTTGTLGVNYLYTILPYLNNTDGELLGAVKATNATYPPVESVLHLTANPLKNNNAIRLNWSHKWANHAKYEVSRNGTVLAEIRIEQASTFEDTTGIPGQFYNYEVRAADSIEGAWVYSAQQVVGINFPILADITALDVQIPDTTLACNAIINRNHTYLTWEYPSQCTGFWVYRNGMLLKVLPFDTYKWRDSTGTPGSASVYQVKAYLTRNGTAYSADGIEKTATFPALAPPHTLSYQAVQDSGAVLLDWSYTENVISGFEVYRMSGAYGTELLKTIAIDSLKGRAFSFWDRTGIMNQLYTYNIKAYTKRNNIVYYSDFAPCQPAAVIYPPLNSPLATANPVATDGTFQHEVAVNWAYLTFYLDGFNVYRNGVLLDSVSKGMRNYRDVSNLSGVFLYEIKAYKWVNINGISTKIESIALADNGSTGQLVPGSIVGFSATKGSLTGAVTLTWQAAGTVFIYKNNVQIASVNSGNYTDNNTVAGKHYLYEVGPNTNDRVACEGWAMADGYVEGSAKTLQTAIALQGAIVEAKITIEGNTYFYKDTTDASGHYAISHIYYGENPNIMTLSATLNQCNATHNFGDNPRTQSLSTPIHNLTQVNFLDLVIYKIKGRINRQHSTCGIDSIRLYATYEFANGTTQNSTPAYSDANGNYSLGVNPIQVGLVKMTLRIDSTKGSISYDFVAQGQTQWTGISLTCLDQISEVNFEDVLTYPVNISVLNGCGIAITGGRYKVQVQSPDVCYDRTFTIDQTTGNVLANLPAIPLNIHITGVENLTTETQLVVDYLSFRPVRLALDVAVDTVNGNSNHPKWAGLTDVKLVYHKPPQVVLQQGFDKYLCNNPQNAAIIQQGNSYALKFQVLENFGSDCVVKNGYVKIRNAAAKINNTTLTFDVNGNLATYTFQAGKPNLVKPYLYSCYVSYYSLSNELLAETNFGILVEGSAQLPGSDIIVDVADDKGVIPLPLYVLRDPPGDASFSTLAKGSTIHKSITLTNDFYAGIGAYADGKALFFGVGLGFEISLKARLDVGAGFQYDVSTTTTEDISTESDALGVGESADVIVGAGLVTQYGLTKQIKVNGCEVTDSTVLGLGIGGIKTTWLYTVGHIRNLIREDSLRIVHKDRISQKGKLESIADSKLYFERKIKNWKAILKYHNKETLPYYNLCATPAPATVSQAQKDIYKAWQTGFCKLIRKNETGAFEPKDNIVWDQTLTDAYNVAETVLKNVVKQEWVLLPFVWEFAPAQLAKRQDYIDAQFEAMHGVAAENLTYSAGVEYNKSIVSAKSSTTLTSVSLGIEFDRKVGLVIEQEIEAVAAPTGLGVEVKNTIKGDARILIQLELGNTISDAREITNENTATVFYHLQDNNTGDQFSFTAIQGISPNQTPYFATLGGRTSCPLEAGTISMDAPKINLIKDGFATKYDERLNVDPQSQASFKVQIINQNPFFLARDIQVVNILQRNSHNASVQLLGDNFSDYTMYAVPPNQPITLDILVNKGADETYIYDSLQLCVMPKCYFDNPALTQSLAIGDTVTFSVHFTNPCSELLLSQPEENWLIQRRNLTSNTNQEALPIKVAGFDVGSNNFQGIYFQYRRIGVQNDWQRIPNSYVSKENLSLFVAANILPNEAPYYLYIWDITDDFERYPNGEYELRSVAECFINGKTVLSYSPKSKGTIDRNQQLIGFPQPSDKMWTYGDEISISFTTDIDCNRIDSTNFVLRNLNSLINGIYTPISGKIYCHNNKLTFIPNAPMTSFDGDTLQFIVSGVYDITGKLLNTETWSFGVYARNLYMDKTQFEVELYKGEQKTLTSHFYNFKPSGNLTYSILGLTPINAGNDGTYSNWFTARNARLVTIAAGTSQTVYFDMNAANLPVGDYMATFNVQDETVPFSMYQNALTFRVKVLPKAAPWQVNTALFAENMTVHSNYRFSNPLLPVNTDTSDLISVWIENELRGVGKIDKIGAYYDAIITTYGNTNDTGKPLTFRVWDSQTGTEYDAFPPTPKTYLKDSDMGSIMNPIVLNVNQIADKARYVYLREGWNLFSFNSQNANDSLRKTLASLTHLTNGNVIKTATRSATFNGTTWITANGLYTTDVYHGYQLHLAKADTLRVTGILPTVLAKDSLFTGWNLISAPVNVPTNLTTLLARSNFLTGSEPDSMVIKTVSPPNEPQYQNMVAYYKTTQNPAWQFSNASGMEAIRPNYGYWLKVDKNTNLCMSSTICAGTTVLRTGHAGSVAFDPFDRQTWVVNPSQYAFNMLITGYVEIDGSLSPLSPLSVSPLTTTATMPKIAAYIGNECRGVGELVYIPELKRYLISLFVYANTENESLSFRIYQPEKDRYYAHFEPLPFETDALIGTLSQPYRFSNLPPDNTFSATAYPNPFQHTLNIDLVADVAQDYTIELCDIMGKTVAVYSHKEANLTESIALKTQGLGLVQGVYLLHIKSSLGEQKTIKVVYNP